MSRITHQTRAESLKKTEKTLNKRQLQVLSILGGNEMTAQEVATEMFRNGICKTDSRNNAAPRLTELENVGYVEEIGKKICAVSGRNVAVYRQKTD